jgi:hypothetical protein
MPACSARQTEIYESIRGAVISPRQPAPMIISQGCRSVPSPCLVLSHTLSAAGPCKNNISTGRDSGQLMMFCVPSNQTFCDTVNATCFVKHLRAIDAPSHECRNRAAFMRSRTDDHHVASAQKNIQLVEFPRNEVSRSLVGSALFSVRAAPP